MPLSVGDQVGPYEVLASIGSGGMGDVYRARDSRLDRLVALKIIRPAGTGTGDPERRRRFLQEARTASALNHPNIVTVYDIGSADGLDYLAMELVLGKPLSQMIPREGLHLNELLRFAIQIADALARAHAGGVIHRDLKPANVMVTPEGVIKVLDFGLAKLQFTSSAAAETAATTTMATAEGTIVGTASYMSPEQVEGKAADARSDIFSFGAMLYEMAAGRRAFRGDSAASIMAGVLREDPPPVSDSRPDLPAELTRLITRCLRKDPARRAHSMADLRVAMEELREESTSGKLPPPPAAPDRPSRRTAFWLALPLAAALATAGYIGWRATSRSDGDVPLQPVPLTSYPGDESAPTFSPDGNQVAFIWNGEHSDNPDIYVKLIGSGVPLRLTTDPRPDVGPKWSPDGKDIAFVRLLSGDTFEVLRVPPLGGAERRIGQFYTSEIYGFPLASLCWTPDSRYLLVAGSEAKNQSNRILRVAVASGEVTTLARIDDGSAGYTWPALSRDGSTLALIHHHGIGDINLLSLSKTFEPGALRKLSLPDHDIRTIAWDPDDRSLIASLVQSNPHPLYRVFPSSGAIQPLAWTGPGASSPAVARQSHRLAFTRAYRDTNIWSLSLDRKRHGQPGLEKLASSSFREVFPHYSPDGKRLVFYSNRSGSVQIWTSNADGSQAEQLTSMDPLATTGSPRWSPDGQYISFDSNAGGRYQSYVIKADGGQPRALTSGDSNNFVTSWSHDGRYIYFTSSRSGEMQIWRLPFAGGSPEQVTRTGGECGEISPDGHSLYFTKAGGTGGVWRMPVAGGEATQLTGAIYRYNYAVAQDGLYFMPAPAVFLATPAADRTTSIRFLNFASGATTEILKIDKPVDLGLAISPDGHNLLFTQVDYVGQDLMLVENFK
jgi:serine/threonine protein kinase